MLVLSRKRNEKILIGEKRNQRILIGENVIITIVEIDRNQVKIGIDAPKEVEVMRAELIKDERHRKNP